MARNCIAKDVIELSEKVTGKRKKNNSSLLLRMSFFFLNDLLLTMKNLK